MYRAILFCYYYIYRLFQNVIKKIKRDLFVCIV